MKNKILFTIVICGLTVFSCTYDSPDDLIESTELPVGNVTYNLHVKPIIDNNCINCHSMPPQNGAPMPLISYQNLKSAVENRGLIQLISTQDLGDVMPLGGPRLPQNLIDTVVQWQIDGFLEE